MSGLNLPMQAMAKLQGEYLNEATALWNKTLGRLQADGSAEPAKLPDRRFSAAEWAQNPAAAYLAQVYLLNARTLMQMAESIEGDAKAKARIRFAVQQWIDAAAPSNFMALNPEAQRKALETKGESISQGLQQLWHDIQQGHVSQTDESVFEVGKNVATTEGAVVYENDMFQLLEYKPLTAKVHEKPFLFVPPCINKYYILDLQPDNSIIRYTVAQGHRVFVVSWRNPDASTAGKTWDDYVEHGVIRAIRAIQQITGQDKLNALGFCVGGTILSTALAVLAARGEQPVASLTLLTTLLDFSNTGVLDLFIDETGVRLREMTIGEKAPNGPGLLNGKELATTFSFLRPNDLVWNYVVGNYLKGEAPPPFDLLYWNSDSTNLPGPMFCWYLRNTYLENKLRVPGALTVCGEKVDLSRIEAPVYLYGSREDHIVPWESAYTSTQLLSGPKRYVLGASGHIAGVINPPQKKKRSFWTNEQLVADANQWLETSTEHPGSWWTDWSDWLKQHAGKEIAAPKTLGNKTYKPIEPAPGRYVKQKA
ncbi:PHA/PHB synthase family protein [Azohydromonas lata]|uniref:Class I poly(R)-hydroxyalkanoic acid synthase n=1 Tax=Azohydromonas lata TaxID=45677 RepID=A0ABU5IKC2_9BURK|nr:class I poly(R)-hydroxyalkanoic acid synthase [Azohydromonas lata]MDZ5459319.1 class I poly(R)-hydroxyalkanoic acid synthase [Azohydromonas lata]